ncbi:MAG TPA: (2Fe-2S)-binding protein [Saprospiraceae bacterium]|nr:(2Fe-2S)-binding protein [Saprospiraceae bacterium]
MNEQSDLSVIKEIKLKINGLNYSVEIDENMPLLWVLRDELGLVGTKYGCGVGLCGSCSILIDGKSMRSCLLSVGSVKGEITTIEGLGTPDSPHQIQEAWIEHQVAQCGYCQPGQMISAYNLLKKNQSPDDQEIDAAMNGNLCRCGTYSRIRDAIKSLPADTIFRGSMQNNGDD